MATEKIWTATDIQMKVNNVGEFMAILLFLPKNSTTQLALILSHLSESETQLSGLLTAMTTILND